VTQSITRERDNRPRCPQSLTARHRILFCALCPSGYGNHCSVIPLCVIFVFMLWYISSISTDVKARLYTIKLATVIEVLSPTVTPLSPLNPSTNGPGETLGVLVDALNPGVLSHGDAVLAATPPCPTQIDTGAQLPPTAACTVVAMKYQLVVFGNVKLEAT
jgi:hypothetical protein